MQEHVIITCALTGAGPLSKNPAQPITPRQIADSGLEAAEAGAAILHIHVRNQITGEWSGELDLYQEVVERIRADNSQVILNLTTGLGSGFYPKDPALPSEAGPGSHIWSAEQRVAHVLRLQPDICTLDLVTAQVFGGIVISTEAVLSQMATLVRKAGVVPELELFDSGDTVLAKHLIKRGVLNGPGIYSFVMGLNFTMPADTETMTYIRNRLPDGAQWQGFGIGRNQYPMAMQSILLGGHVRVGMEDNVYIRRGEFAESNAQQVVKARSLIDAAGTATASVEQARSILELPAHVTA